MLLLAAAKRALRPRPFSALSAPPREPAVRPRRTQQFPGIHRDVPRPRALLQLDLRTQLAHPVARDVEVPRRAPCVARQSREQALAPEGHAWAMRREQRLAAEEERRLFGVCLLYT